VCVRVRVYVRVHMSVCVYVCLCAFSCEMCCVCAVYVCASVCFTTDEYDKLTHTRKHHVSMYQRLCVHLYLCLNAGSCVCMHTCVHIFKYSHSSAPVYALVWGGYD